MLPLDSKDLAAERLAAGFDQMGLDVLHATALPMAASKMRRMKSLRLWRSFIPMAVQRSLVWH
jgi:hypothetical protein